MRQGNSRPRWLEHGVLRVEVRRQAASGLCASDCRVGSTMQAHRLRQETPHQGLGTRLSCANVQQEDPRLQDVEAWSESCSVEREKVRGAPESSRYLTLMGRAQKRRLVFQRTPSTPLKKICSGWAPLNLC